MPEHGTTLGLDPVVHGPLRLAVLSLLAGIDHADFKWLRQKTGCTDGNLGSNLSRLEEAGYVTVTRRFVGKKPNSTYRLTPSGRKALAGYIKALKSLLRDSL